MHARVGARVRAARALHESVSAALLHRAVRAATLGTFKHVRLHRTQPPACARVRLRAQRRVCIAPLRARHTACERRSSSADPPTICTPLHAVRGHTSCNFVQTCPLRARVPIVHNCAPPPHAQVACGCLVCVYLVVMKDPQGESSNYCDMAEHVAPGLDDETCYEIDLLEANSNVIQSAVHTEHEGFFGSGQCKHPMLCAA